MAIAQSLQAPVGEPAGGTSRVADAPGTSTGQALVPVLRSLDDEEATALSGPVARLPVEMDVSVPVREFRVRDLLALGPGRVLESRWAHGIDVPLAAGVVQLAQSEFEVIETRLAVRITRLA